MSPQHDRYTGVRNPDHSTLGDAADRYQRDSDAFTAGAQYALDKIVGTIDRVLMDPHTSEYLIGRATEVLQEVQEGRL